MNPNYIKIKEFCTYTKIEDSFITNLSEEGILKIEIIDDEPFVEEEIIPELEMFSRWHYDLGINLEGIDAMRHMLQRMNKMKSELEDLRRKLVFYSKDFDNLP
ncbi:chaperone modulator CbpM [Weeksellaceae bacterium TAE3-ERU29]|nr:chaperone modulator CbpM [Weeksellaceae bacterium TAE3-ERU29]